MLDNFFKIYAESKFYIDIAIGFLISIIFWLSRKIVSKRVLKIIGKIVFNKDDKEVKRESLVSSLQKPFSLFIGLIGIFIGIYINYPKPAVTKAFKILIILDLCWCLVNYLSDNLFLLFHFGEDADNKTNTTVFKFVSNLLKIIVILFAVMMVISELGYNVSGFITGLGVGGLAISLAAKDALSNLISGFIIVFEKPFIVGEFIRTSTIEGWVEDVHMRATKIRTIEDSIVTVPNSTITNDAIVNLSRVDKRLISLEFGLIYSTPNELIKKCQADIEQYLIDDEDVLPTPLRVNLKTLDDSSLNISITCYTTKTDLNDYHKTINNVNLKIKEIIEENGAEFAFPTSSVYIENK